MTLQRRYLELLRKSLLNEIYLESDARTLYVFTALQAGERVEGDVLRNIRARRPAIVAQLERDRSEGSPWWNVSVPGPDGAERKVSMRNYCDFTHSMIGARRMRNIEECLDVVRSEGIRGDLAETGVWRGGAAVFMRGYLAAYDMADRIVWAADSFAGLPPPTHAEDAGYDYSAAQLPILAVSLEEVRGLFARYGLLDERVRFLEGWFRDTLPAAPIDSLALLRVDGDLYESTMDSLAALYDKVVPGGFVLVDDYGDFPPCRKAVDDFRGQRGVRDPLVMVDWSGAYWRKS
jgi:O-methyltransferase